jgi:hypothetical protein
MWSGSMSDVWAYLLALALVSAFLGSTALLWWAVGGRRGG